MTELDYVVRYINQRFGFCDQQLFNSRSKRAVRARRAVYLALRHLDWSLYEIGNAFGKHHTTVLFSLQKVKPIEEQFANRAVAFVHEEIRGYGLDD